MKFSISTHWTNNPFQYLIDGSLFFFFLHSAVKAADRISTRPNEAYVKSHSISVQSNEAYGMSQMMPGGLEGSSDTLEYNREYGRGDGPLSNVSAFSEVMYEYVQSGDAEGGGSGDTAGTSRCATIQSRASMRTYEYIPD